MAGARLAFKLRGGIGVAEGRLGERTKGWFLPFLFIFVAMAYLSFMVSLPLITPLAWAVLLSFIVFPLFSRMKGMMLSLNSDNLPAALVTGMIALLVVIPVVYAGYVAAREGIRIYEVLSEELPEGDFFARFNLSSLLPAFVVDKLQIWAERFPLAESVRIQAGEWLAVQVASVSRMVLGNTVTVAYYLVVIIVGCFFLLRDGSLIIDYLKDIVPLPAEERDAFFRRAKEVLQAVVYGVIVTAFIQGILGGAGWWYAGLDSPVFFGFLMVFLAMIPFVGTALLWVPAAGYLLYAGRVGDGVFLILWGIFAVSMADSFIRPLFISGGGKVHLLIVFIGVVGGLASWGFLGLFMGPLVLSLFAFLLESYRAAWRGYMSGRADCGDE